ncbi:hypothetical protein [Streptomyces sp. NPDC057336]
MSVTSAAPGSSAVLDHRHEWALVDVETSGLVPVVTGCCPWPS